MIINWGVVINGLVGIVKYKLKARISTLLTQQADGSAQLYRTTIVTTIRNDSKAQTLIIGET